MRDSVPNFQPYPYAQLPRIARRDAALVSAVARWLRASTRGGTAKLAALFGGPVEVRVVGMASVAAVDPHGRVGFDPHAAFTEVRAGGAAVVIAGSSSGIRLLAQRLLGGPAELAAPRPLTLAERAVFALVVAAALADAGIAAEAWPLDGAPPWVTRSEPLSPAATVAAHGAARPAAAAVRADGGSGRAADAADGAHRVPAARAADGGAAVAHAATKLGPEAARAPTKLAAPDAAHAATRFAPDAETRTGPPAGTRGIELAIMGGRIALTVVLHVPPGFDLRAPPRAPVAWALDLAVVVAGCTLPRDAVGRLAVGDVVVVERSLALAIGEGTVGLAAVAGAIEARVVSGYVPRVIGDDAHLELTVQLGTTRLSARRLADLAVGEIVPLGRPLAGPYEIRVAGRLIGQGELVDVDGELGVRIVSIEAE